MSKAEEIAEIAADGVADGLHIVGEEVLAAEKVVQNLSGLKLAYFGLGLAAGAAAGAFAGFAVAYRKAETKFQAIADEQIEEMREHYASKVVALEATQSKGELDKLVREKGYSNEQPEPGNPPMAVTPPQAVVEAAQEAAEEAAIEEQVDVRDPEPEVRNVFRDNEPPEDDWDWHKERSRRSPMHPYVIHRDEREEHDVYDSVTFTYFEEDDVVCNERDEVISKNERDKMFGETNLEKFGHGSGDANTVYVRNDQLEIVFEIVRSPNSYAEEVHGFESEPEIRHSHRRTRVSIDDE